MKTTSFVVLVINVLSLAFYAPASASVIDITAGEAFTMMGEYSDLMVIDVSPVWADGHIPGSINLYVGDGQLDAALPYLNKNMTYIVYCHTDGASNLAVNKMSAAGFMNIYRLYGNFSAWQDAGYDVDTPSYTDVSAVEAKALIDENPSLIVIDVSPIYADGHIPGAINIYVGDDVFDNAVAHLDPNADYLVYCHNDAASILGAQSLVDAGFSSVKRLAGNYSAWTGAGYATEVSDGTYTDISASDANVLLTANPDVVVIDVSPHYAEGHLPGAFHFPLGDGALHAIVPFMTKTDQILLYCHVDAVAIAGAQLLVDAGFTNVYRLEGNYGGWTGAGYDVETPAYTDVSAAEAKVLIEGDNPPVVIDVSQVYESGHIPGSFHYSLGDGVIDLVTAHLMPNNDYLVYCHTDGASMSGAQALIDAGFTRVQRLEGNYSAWTGAGYDIEVSPPDYRDITPLAAVMLIDDSPGIIIVDVSTHYNEGHIPDAVNYPFVTNEFAAQVPSFDSENIYLIYCHGDTPSRGASELLIESGFEMVYRLSGNYSAWVDAGLPVSVPTAVSDETPTAFGLVGIYPNPFNPTTTVEFEIPGDSQVNLAVYDMLGRKVTDLVDGALGAGSHAVRWNGRDADGNATASGLYIVQLNADGMTAFKKITLVK